MPNFACCSLPIAMTARLPIFISSCIALHALQSVMNNKHDECYPSSYICMTLDSQYSQTYTFVMTTCSHTSPHPFRVRDIDYHHSCYMEHYAKCWLPSIT